MLIDKMITRDESKELNHIHRSFVSILRLYAALTNGTAVLMAQPVTSQIKAVIQHIPTLPH